MKALYLTLALQGQQAPYIIRNKKIPL